MVRQKRVQFLALASVAAIAIPVPVVHGQVPSRPISDVAAKIETQVRRILQDTRIPAISIALVVSGDVVWADAYGLANVDARLAATADTYFSTGSTLKPVTAAAVMHLVDAGKLSLDQSLNAIVGPDRGVSGADDVTLRHLLAHYSGLEGPVDIVSLWSREPLKSAEETLGATKRVAKPGLTYRYCNECYAAVGYVIELVSGVSFDEFLTSRILRPIGVEARSPTRPTPQMIERLALPYGSDSGTMMAIDQIRTNVFAAGDAYLRPKDMAAFLAALLNGGIYRGHRILTEASAAEIMRPQFGGSGSGLGINVSDIEGRQVVTKNGIFNGYHSYMIGDPRTRNGAYVVANSTAAGRVVAAIARYSLRLLWGESPAPLPSFRR